MNWCHRTNIIKILPKNSNRTLKNHLLSGLATCDDNYPIHEWDRLLPQCELTLNLLQNLRINSKLSSWALLNGNHDFNKVQLAPPETKVVIHNKPGQRKSWQYHGTEGWYIGPAHEHYRCLTCYLPITRTKVVSNTVRLLPARIPIPQVDLDDYIRASIQELVHLLHNWQSNLPVDTISREMEFSFKKMI